MDTQDGDRWSGGCFTQSELGAQHSPHALLEGLRRDERVVYTQNGNRHAKGHVFLRKLQEVAPRYGISRVADISFLSSVNYPVYQSCRPAIYSHSDFGQNTGSQGKGPSPVQAKISCLAEALESYCAEPRNSMLIRGSYRFLRDQHLVADPRAFIRNVTAPAVKLDESLAWTWALSLDLQRPVLLPAETIYCPFFAQSYKTRSVFPISSNGLASGSTYLEATLHGIYEVIERRYNAALEQGHARVQALFEDEIELPGFRSFLGRLDSQFELQLYAIELDGPTNLPVVMCLLVGDDLACEGWGCSMTVEISLSRAISEAFQNLSTIISGTREDMSRAGRHSEDGRSLFKHGQPKRRTLHLERYRRRVIDRRFESLQQELATAVDWVSSAGYRDILVANLTRHGIDIPVVKVVVPGMEVPSDMRLARGRYKPMLSVQYPTMDRR